MDYSFFLALWAVWNGVQFPFPFFPYLYQGTFLRGLSQGLWLALRDIKKEKSITHPTLYTQTQPAASDVGKFSFYH